MFPRAERLLRYFSLGLVLTQGLAVVLSPTAAHSQESSRQSRTSTTADVAGAEPANSVAASPVVRKRPSSPVTAPMGLSLGIVIDESSAMRSTPDSLRAAVDRLLKPMRDEDEAFVVAAKDKPMLLQDFTSDPAEIDRKLGHLKLKGKTPLLDAIVTALDHLEDASNERTAIVVLASGQDNASSASLQTVRQKLTSTRVPVYCLAAKSASWESQDLLQNLAVANGGSALFPRGDRDFKAASAELSKRLFGEQALTAKEKPLSAYEVAVVRSIPVASGPDTATFPEGDNVILQKMLVKTLRAKKLFPKVVDGTTPDGLDRTTPSGSAETPAGPLEVLGTVVEYRPASQRQARFIRFGGRSALVKVQFLFRDAQTGRIVMKSLAEGKVDTGVLGGSAEKVETQAVMRAVDDLVDDIAKNR